MCTRMVAGSEPALRGSFGSEVGVEDDDPCGTPQAYGDGGSRLDGDLEVVRGAIG